MNQSDAMKTKNGENGNPLNMRQIEENGPFVLPATPCSPRRVEFFKRANTVLGFYSAVSMTSKTGQDVISQYERDGKFKQDTPIRINMGPSGGIIQTNYGLLKKQFTEAGVHLTNQVFLMLYGNFEAYLSDLVLDALTQIGSTKDPYEDTVRLMLAVKWRGKIDRIGQVLSRGLCEISSN